MDNRQSKYQVVIDWASGHKIVNKETGNEYFITGSELVSYMNYSTEQIRENMSFVNAIRHIDDYLFNLIK
jgi:hypothetical protein